VPEGGREVVEEFLPASVVLLVTLVGVERPCTGGSTGGRAAEELGAHRRCGEWCRMQENEIGGAEEHQRVTAELWLHWIRVRGWCGWLSTMARYGGGGRVMGGDRSRRN
jgi:hypothetical protein